MKPTDHRTDLFGEKTLTALILQASGKVPDADLHAAWTGLVKRYEDAVRVCLRNKLRHRTDIEADARDFFTYLYATKILPKYERSQGSFRRYIQGVIDRYARNLTRSGGRRRPQELEDEALPMEGLSSRDFELEEERAWAEVVLAQALRRLREEKPRQAEILASVYGLGRETPLERDELAQRLGLKLNALNVDLHRGRERLAALIREELSSLCSSPEEFEIEQRCLVQRLLDAHADLVSVGRAAEVPASPSTARKADRGRAAKRGRST